MINLKPVSQNDPRWRDDFLGSSQVTIGAYGCAMCSSLMAAQAFAVSKTPDEIALHSEVFDPISGALSWQPLAIAIGVDFGYRYDTDTNPNPRHMRVQESAARLHIDFLASLGIPAICKIDSNPNTPELDEHWVTYVGDGMCIDPWDGRLRPLGETYGKLWGVGILNGTPVLVGGKLAAMVGKANEIHRGRNVDLNASEIMQVINRP